MPNQPATPVRSVRVPDELWDQVKRRADDEGKSLTQVVLDALRQHVRG
ncbi:YlcI/YnfO family protein [Nocardioides jensenii]|nr:YlcI/YnfO family protein [Nocardioides jensenii]